MVNSLKLKTIHALSWSFIDTAVSRVVQFIIGIVLARMLFPEQFGLIGMLYIFISVAQAFLLGGFGTALIQKTNSTHVDNCSIFYFNITIGVLCSIILILIAPFISSFYNQPILTPIMRVLSLSLVINSIGVIQYTILVKNLDFKLLTIVSLISSLMSGLIGVTFAIYGFGVWSLVSLQLSESIFRTISLWLVNTWRPSLTFSINAMRNMFGFGSKILISNILNQFFENIYYIIFGKLFSASDLGYFTRAKLLQETPSNTFAEIIGRVFFPVFSKIKDDHVNIRIGYKTVIRCIALINFPMMIGLAVVSPKLVVVLLTDRWLQTIPYVQLLCAVGSLYPLQLININVLTALGQSGVILRIEIIKKMLIVANILVTWRYGITIMVYGMIVVSIISYCINCYYSNIYVRYSILEQIYDIFPYILVSSIMGIVIYIVGMLPINGLFIGLIIQIGLGIIIYLFICWVFKLKAYLEIVNMDWNSINIFSKH